MLNVAGDALKGDEKALKFNEDALKSDSNALNDDGNVLEGRFGCVKVQGETLRSNGKVFKDEVDSIKVDVKALKSNEKTLKGEEIKGNMGTIVLMYVHQFQNYLFGKHNNWRKSLWSCLFFQIFRNFMSAKNDIQFIV